MVSDPIYKGALIFDFSDEANMLLSSLQEAAEEERLSHTREDLVKETILLMGEIIDNLALYQTFDEDEKDQTASSNEGDCFEIASCIVDCKWEDVYENEGYAETRNIGFQELIADRLPLIYANTMAMIRLKVLQSDFFHGRAEIVNSTIIESTLLDEKAQIWEIHFELY